MGNSDSLTDRVKFRLLISTRCRSCTAPVRASRAIPHDFPCVSPLLPRKLICRFWQFSSGQMPSLPLTSTGSAIPSSITRLHVGSLTLQPAGLLDSLTEPLSENSVLQVTLNTSLQLCWRTGKGGDIQRRGTSYIAPVKRKMKIILSLIKAVSYKILMILGTLFPLNPMTDLSLTRRFSRS